VAQETIMTTTTHAPPAPRRGAPARTREEVIDLAARAERGEKGVLPALREALADPDLVRLFGDTDAVVRSYLLRRLDNPVLKEVMPRRLVLMRHDLVGAGPPPVEALIAERAVTCWVHLEVLELTYAASGPLELGVARYYHQAIALAERRYLAALRTLALVRKLLAPRRAGGAAGEGRPPSTSRPYDLEGPPKVPAPSANGNGHSHAGGHA
jgi:hypothetical protein